MKEFKEFVFLRHFWILDLLTVIAFALFFGYCGQVTADSGKNALIKS